jgi:DNA-entry nuclease
MPIGERGETGQIKPTGWHTVKYDIVDGKFLYNRCHLIGWQLTGETSNERNLITGTRYLNIQGMLPFENMVADYIKETENHVLYRVTPCFEKNNLLAHGVQIEAYSVEDDGAGVCFNVFCYNVQPGVTIDYSSGNSKLINDTSESATPKATEIVSKATTQKSTSNSSVEKADYVANTNTGKFHYPSCSSVDDMKEENKMLFNGTRDELISEGYVPCKRCNP